MSCFFVDFHGDAGSVDGTVPRKSFADNFMGLLMGDHVIKLQPDPLEYRWPGMDADGIIIVKGAVIFGADFNNRIDIAAFLDLAIRIGRVAHQRRPAEFKIAQIVGMVDDLGAIRVRIKCTILTLMPHQPVGLIPHVALITVIYFGGKWFGPQFTPP